VPSQNTKSNPRRRRTKIVATLGPASATAEMIRALYVAGVDVFRLNFSHGSHDDHAARVKTLRALEQEFSKPVGILADMQGPKLRIGKFKNSSIDLTASGNYQGTGQRRHDPDG